MKIAAIGDPTFIVGFQLVGVEGFKAEGDEEVRKILSEIIEKGEYGLIILPERYVEATKEIRLKVIKEGRITPIFAFMEDYTGIRGERTKELMELLSLAIGAKLKI